MKRSVSKSGEAFARATRVLVGGVNSPVRAFAAVGGTPPVIARAAGAHIFDVDGNDYVDYVGSYGPAILGHAHPDVVAAIASAAAAGTSYGAPTEAETLLAEEIVAALPSVEKVRFVSSGTEAVMTAVRLARGFTGRSKIVKFIGCYHGHSDALLVSAGSGALTLGMPSSPGVPAGATADTALVRYNDIETVERVFEEYPNEVAAVLIEPVVGNMGVVLPAAGFLRDLRDLCTQNGVLLIFDEVMTGFRVAYGGVQSIEKITPDLTTLGKIIGGGMPVGAIGGRAEIMDRLAPLGPVYQAGTLSGNPAAMAAGLATLRTIRKTPDFYAKLEAKSARLADGLKAAAAKAGVGPQTRINRVGSMMTVFFTPGPVTDFDSATASNTKAFAAYFQAMLEAGVYLPPSQYEAIFVSIAHTEADIQATMTAASAAFAAASR